MTEAPLLSLETLKNQAANINEAAKFLETHVCAWESMDDESISQRISEIEEHLGTCLTLTARSDHLSHEEVAELLMTWGRMLEAIPRASIVSRARAQLERAIRALMMRSALSANARRGGVGRVAKNPRALQAAGAMGAIKVEFDRWQSGLVRYENDADFARQMHSAHAATIKNEGSIKNACGRWRRDRKAKSSS